MPLTELEAQLRMIARDRIASGELPCVTPPLRMWGGYGSGRVCVVCDKIIEPADVEYEVEETIKGTLQLMYFHLVCQSIWQLECARAAYLKSCGKKPNPPV
jgi:hypothetical protein